MLLSRPRKLSVGTVLVAFAGVVVDDVEDDLDAGLVEGLDHLLEFVDLVARPRPRTPTWGRRTTGCYSPSSSAAVRP